MEKQAVSPKTGPVNAWTQSDWPIDVPIGQRKCRVVNNNVSRLPGHWSRTRWFFSWTSRREISDSHNGDQIMALLCRLVDETKQTVFMVTHDPRHAAMVDRLIVLRDGRVADERDQVFEHAPGRDEPKRGDGSLLRS